MKRVKCLQWTRLVRMPFVALFATAAGMLAVQPVTEITLPGTLVFPESITSTADGTLIVGSLGHGNVMRIAPGQATAGSLSVVLATAIAFGGFGQIFAGMWEFKVGNTFGATAFTSYGLFWISFVLIETIFAPDLPKDPTPILGMYALGWGIFTAYMFVASLRTTGAVALVFFLLTITFILLGIGNSGGHEGITEVGGWTGLLTAAAAWYASMAAVVNSTFGKTVMPVVPLGD